MDNYTEYFNDEEMEWLKKNTGLKKQLFLSIKDQSNVNPLANGEPDLKPFQNALTAIKLTIEIAQKKLISGPYDISHFRIIKAHFPVFNIDEASFWNIFSLECALKKEETKTSKENIYMQAICSIAATDNLDLLDYNNIGKVYDMNDGVLKPIRGIGVNARL